MTHAEPSRAPGPPSRRLLILSKGMLYAVDRMTEGKYALLSERYEGDVVHLVEDKALRSAPMSRFRLRGLYVPEWLQRAWKLHNLYYALAIVWSAWAAHRFRHPYDVIIAREPIATGPLALVIRMLIRVPVIVEVNGNYMSPLIWEREVSSLYTRLRYRYCARVIPFVLERADGVKLLYERQIEPFRDRLRLRRPPVCFHDFVPVGEVPRGDGQDNDVLFLGHPWHLKGADVLIGAFRRIADDFPEVTLNLVGYFPEPAASHLAGLAGGHPRIEIRRPVPYAEALALISRCRVMALPSRTEAMGRVILEAMACAKPVVASRVDGIPTYVLDGKTGLLCDPGSVDDLADKLRAVLADPDLADRLGAEGYRHVHAELSEARYLERYADLIERVCGAAPSP